ncbi:autotransporter family protein [Falsiruegeria mediterranea]|uniref:autotransporter family protein n=1 Tax=Falsiruegeria mediterranea TaxID=1280832 RepID=UPI0015F25F33|nr:autotransporter outer membrane beta-barrel domain-containing protein [Falsiruegeria mediterranea]
MKIILFPAIISLAFSTASNADPFISPTRGFVNVLGGIGTSDPKYDSLLFKYTTEAKLYFEEDLTYQQPDFYNVWENVTFNDPLAASRMSVDLLGTNLSGGDRDLSRGYVRLLRISDMTLNNVDFNSDAVKLIFIGNDNSLTLNNSTMDLRDIEILPQAGAPMLLQVQSGVNKFTGWKGNISPSEFTLNIASGASLELFYSGDLGVTSIPGRRVNFRGPIQGTIDGELFLHYSNVYMNSTDNLEFTNGSKLRLKGSRTLLEVEEIAFDSSAIDLGINTTLQVNQEIKLANTALSFGNQGVLVLNTDGVISTLGNVSLDGSDTNSGIRGKGLLHLNNLGGSTQFSQHNIAESSVDVLIIQDASSMDLQNTIFTVNSQMQASHNASINLVDSTFALNGYTGRNSSLFDLNADNLSFFRVNSRGEWYQSPNSAINNEGSIYIEGNYFANGTIDGNGLISIVEDGVMDFGFNDHNVYTLVTDNRILFEPDFLNQPTSADGGALKVRLDVTGGSASNDRILYGDGDVTLTQMRALNVGLTQALTADELDGQTFTLIQAQNSGVAGTLIDGASAPLVEGADIPALIDFTITDTNTNGKPDLTLNAQKQNNNSLLTHPSATTANHQGAAQLAASAGNSGNTTINNTLNQLTNSQVGSYLNSLHPEAYASNMTVALEHSDHLRNMVLGSARGIAAGGDRVAGLTDEGRRVWMDSGLMEGTIDKNGDLAGFNYNLGNVVLGADLWSNGNAVVGAFLGYGRYSMDEHSISTAALDFASDTYHIGAYGNYDVSNWAITGMAGFSWANTKATREAFTGTGSNIHKADYDSRTFQAEVRAEYTNFLTSGSWSVSPEIGLGYARYDQDAFTESGPSDTALAIQNATAESLVGSIGLNLSGPAFAGGLEPLASLRYEHDFLAARDSAHEINAAFASSPGVSQSFVGTHRGPDAVSISLGLRSAPGRSVDVSAGVVYAKNTYGDEFGGGLRVSWRF